MPDFDTRRPQEQNVPNEPRIGLVANKLRSALLATRLRALLVGVGILLFVVAVYVALLIYSTIRLDDRQPFVLSYAGHIWTMNIDGSDRQQLTDTGLVEESPVEESQPAWSPDHQKIAFVRSHEHEPLSGSGTPETQDFIYVMNADGFWQFWQRKLLNAYASGPTWSPDGERIAFSAELRQEGTTSIYVMNSDGSGKPRRLTNGLGDLSPAWSPDGERIAFERSYHIYVMKACCGKYYTAWRRTKQLTAGPGWDREPVWSPDGSELAFTHVDFGEGQYGVKEIQNTDVYKIDADGSGETRLTDTYSSLEHDAVWSPSGDQLAFIEGYYTGTHAECYDTIYLMESDGSLPRVVRRVTEACEMDLDWR